MLDASVESRLEAVREEALAVREKVGLMDLSTFSKFEVKGRDAYAFLERICANKIPSKDGGIILGHLLNENGFIESEITVTRLGPEHFYVLSAAVAQLHDRDQLEWRKVPGEAVEVTDITDEFGVLVLAGPLAREVLQLCTTSDLSNAGFRWLTGKAAMVAGVNIRLLRVNYVGELGWELYIPTEFVAHVFERLCEAGAEFGLTPAGMHTMNNCRTEKAYRHWGHDMSDEETPLEAGLGFAIAWDKKGGFIGRDALLKQKALTVLPKRMVCIALEDSSVSAPMMYHEEPIYRNGVIVGSTTSGAWGHRVNLSLGMGYVSNDGGVTKDWIESGKWEVELAWKRYGTKVQLQSFYDPKGERIKA